MQNSILFDIGKTKTRVAFTENSDSFESPEIFATDLDYEKGLANLIAHISKVSNGRDVKNIVGGMSRSMEGWSYERLAEDLKNKFGVAVYLDNDSAVVALGEAHFGAGKGFKIVAYVTVSTGVGGARIVDGKIDRASVGFEPGKQIIDIENGSNKTLEDLISGKALEIESGKHPKEITDPNVWEEHAKLLAIGLNNVVVNWSPDVLVLGGSMITGDPAIPLPKTEERLREILKVFPNIPVVKKAELEDFGGLWGSLVLLKNLQSK